MVTPNHVYWLPIFDNIPRDSIIHRQVVGHQGFFNHPVLILEFDEDPNIVCFLPLTTFRGNYGTGPTPFDIRVEYIAIQGLTSPPDDEVKVQVAPGSPQMVERTWMKMEVFRIEAVNLQQYLRKTVEIDANGMDVIRTRLRQLAITPGAVMQVPEETTIGIDSVLHTQIGDEREGYSILNHLAVVLEVNAVVGHDGTPVLNLDRISSPLSQDVYVKTGKSYWIEIGRLKYYQFPSVRLDPLSTRVLLNYYFPFIHDRTLGSYLGRAPSPSLDQLPSDLPRDQADMAPILQHQGGPEKPQTPPSAASLETRNPFLPVYPLESGPIQEVQQQEQAPNPYRPVFPAEEAEAFNPYRPVYPD